MSHFTKVKTRIMDLESLELALNELDYRVIHEARIRGWQNQQKKAAVVAQFPKLSKFAGFPFNEKSTAQYWQGLSV